MLTFLDALGVYSVHRLADGRWEALASDDDPRPPSWRRIAIVGGTGRPTDLESSPTHLCGSDGVRREAVAVAL